MCRKVTQNPQSPYRAVSHIPTDVTTSHGHKQRGLTQKTARVPRSCLHLAHTPICCECRRNRESRTQHAPTHTAATSGERSARAVTEEQKECMTHAVRQTERSTTEALTLRSCPGEDSQQPHRHKRSPHLDRDERYWRGFLSVPSFQTQQQFSSRESRAAKVSNLPLHELVSATMLL